MSLPTASDVHLDAALTNASVAYVQTEANFLASASMFPQVPVSVQTGNFRKYNKGDFARVEAQERAPGSKAAEVGYRIDTNGSYACKVYALRQPIPKQVRANQTDAIDMDRDVALYLTQQMLLKREKVWATNFIAGSTWTGGTGGATDQAGVSSTSPAANQFTFWSDYANSTPIIDIKEQAISLAKSIYRRPGELSLAVGPEVWSQLAHHPDMTDLYKHTTAGAVLSEELVAKVLGIKRVVVAWAVENTAVEGQTATAAFVVGKSALLCFSPDSPSLMTPAAGYGFAWTGYAGSTPLAPTVSKWWDQETKSDIVEVEMAFDFEVVAADAGAYFATCVA